MAIKTKAKYLTSSAIKRIRKDNCKNIIERWKSAFELGFYFECITLTECMILDRMEARRAFLLCKEVYFKNEKFSLSEIASRLQNEETCRDDNIIYIIGEILRWCQDCNHSSHYLAKEVYGNINNQINERIKEYKKIAKKGLILYKKIDTAVKRLNTQS